MSHVESRQSGATKASRSRPRRASIRQRLSRFTRRPGRTGSGLQASGRTVHVVSAIVLVVGLFMPIFSAGQSLAAPIFPQTSTNHKAQNDNTVIGNPSQVSISGDFGQFSLTDFDGVWKGVFPVPAGSYSYQFVVAGSDGNQYTFGSGGLNGGTEQITINDGDLGLFAQFNAHTYETVAQPVAQLFTLSTSNGEIPLQPDNGNLTAIVNSQGGDFGYQLLSSGNPVGDQQNVSLDQGPVRLTIDTNGQVVNTQTLTAGSLTISRTDRTGNPLPGGCYQLRSGGSIVNQGCDNGNGTTTLTFPEGINPGSFTLVEVIPPAGQDKAPDQDVSLQPGDNSVTIQPAAGVEPTSGPDVQATDTPAGGGNGGDNNGIETPTQEGGIIGAPTDESSPTESATVESTPTETPAPTAAQPGDLVVTIEDENGQPLGNSCFELLNAGGNVAAQTCDATDPTPNNGRVGFYGVPAGQYTLHASQSPDGADAIVDRQVQIQGGQETDETVQVSLTQTPTTEPTATAAEEPTQEPTATATEEPTLEPTQEIPTEEVTVERTQEVTTEIVPPTADGGIVPDASPTAETPTEQVSPTDETAPSPTAGAYGDPGDLIIELRDGNDRPVGNSCFELVDDGNNVAAQTCDATDQTPNNGRLGFYGIPSGTYTLRESTVPDGTQQIPDRSVTVVAGEQTSETLSTSAPSGDTTPTDQASATDAAPTETPVAVATDEGSPTETSTVETGSDTGAVRVDVSSIATDGTPVCVALDTSGGIGFADPPSGCDNGQGDRDPADGTIMLNDIAPGEYTVSITEGPQDALNLPAQNVVVEAAQVVDVSFGGAIVPTVEPTATDTETPTLEPTATATATSTPEPSATATATETPTREPTATQVPSGSILSTIKDTGGKTIVSACISVDGGIDVCDNTANDRDPAVGAIRVDDVALGQHAVAVTSFPAAYLQPDLIAVEVTAGATATAVFTLETAPPQTGSAKILFTIQGGTLPNGLCVQLTNTNGGAPFGTFCDNGNDDSDSASGTISLTDVPVGTYAVKLAAESRAKIDGFKSATTGTLIIPANGTDDVTIAIVADPAPTTGTVEIATRNNATNQLLAGACYELRPAAGGSTIAVCDNDPSDQNGTNGLIRLIDVPAGTFTLVMTTAPIGFTPYVGEQTMVVAGALDQLEVRLDAVAQTSTLTIRKIDQNGKALKNACFALRQGNTTPQTICDATDETPGDGSVVFKDVKAGVYQVVETRTPTNDYQAADPVSVRIIAGQNQTIDVTNIAKTGRLVVTKVDSANAGSLLPNACFQLKSSTHTYGPFCDADDSVVDGKTTFDDVVPGNYTLIETAAPSRYRKAANRDITIDPGSSVYLTVANEKLPPPTESGTLIVHKQDVRKKALPGGCFRLYDGVNPVTTQVCDNTDGKNDATIIFNKVPVGTWTLRETLAPSTDYQIAPDRQVTISNGQTTEVSVPNSLKTGRVQVRKTDPNGNPLQGVCFDLATDGRAQQCTDANGNIIFTVAVGVYSLTETTTPAGYIPAPKVENIRVQPGQTTIVSIVNKLAPPPANTGSVQVLKFVCPAAAGQSKTQFLGGSAGNAQLAKTANCNPASAGFTLKAQKGEGGPGAFTTNGTGKYQVTVTAGLYTLTETSPDLPGNSQVALKVVKGQLTTVVVINFVEPPKPAAATIQVTKYTCASSFNGTLYDDFQQNCSAATQLTNGVTTRVEGPVTQKHVTGDNGKTGQSTFANLTAGTYTISEDRPFNIPVNYIFCGLGSNWPADSKAVNSSLSVALTSGQTLHCAMFDVPEVPKKDTGTILVHKYVCDVKSPPKGFDYDAECRLSDQEARFQISAYNTNTQKFDAATIGRANPDGLLRFRDLKPGTYQLLEVDGKWCHAKSNNVDSKGNVVVKPNAYSEVWIYNCVAPTSPPNTGSGDAAGMLDPVGGNTGVAVLISIAWPLLAAGLWVSYRNRRRDEMLATRAIRRNENDRRAA